MPVHYLITRVMVSPHLGINASGELPYTPVTEGKGSNAIILIFKENGFDLMRFPNKDQEELDGQCGWV